MISTPETNFNLLILFFQEKMYFVLKKEVKVQSLGVYNIVNIPVINQHYKKVYL